MTEKADEFYKQASSHTGVRLGISETLETCSRCGQQFVHLGGAEEPPKHVNTGKTICPDCIGLDCERCGRHYPGEMRPIPGTPYSRCMNCDSSTPSKNKNKYVATVIGAHGRVSDRS